MKVFIGPKQQVISNCDFFDASITLIGDNTGTNTSFSRDIPFEFWNDDNNEQEIQIYNAMMRKCIFGESNVEIMAYNPRLLDRCSFPQKFSQICKNDIKLLDCLDDKFKDRDMLCKIVPMLDYHILLGSEIPSVICPGCNMYVIQSSEGCGGAKTYLCHAKNSSKVFGNLNPSLSYSVTNYVEKNISYTISAVIHKNGIEILPAGQQMFEISDIIEWAGTDYNITIPRPAKEKLASYTTDICCAVRRLGYLGIINLDFIYALDELYFMEINPRFAGSIYIVDNMLKQSGLPSTFELNYMSFYHHEIPSTRSMVGSLFL